ncbi:THO complex subunit 4 [Trichinella spiralis]|uniref:THO complex subunit 4-B n=1 Tax=Trichinella spiralis TaxID=6334 RepID=E5SF41_TRISP|nr:THO complex subunit 4 [Trichinella spiralis]KRY40811.1 THO complex subunit 4-B [Trichinella spiralis]
MVNPRLQRRVSAIRRAQILSKKIQARSQVRMFRTKISSSRMFLTPEARPFSRRRLFNLTSSSRVEQQLPLQVDTPMMSVKNNTNRLGIIVVSNLAMSVTKADLVELFSSVGSLQKVPRMLRPGIAVVTFKKKSSALLAVTQFHGTRLDGQTLFIEIVATEPDNNNNNNNGQMKYSPAGVRARRSNLKILRSVRPRIAF